MPVVPASDHAIEQAAQALARGEIIAFPTETVYGLGANALEAHAVARVFAAKERPHFNPLIVHVPSSAEAERYAVVTDTARLLAQAFWPGPLSLVLMKRPSGGICDLASAGLETVALRMPAHPVAQALLAAAKLPIAAPSANRSGRISPTTAAHVAAELDDRPALILDGGPCPLGIEFNGDRRVGRTSALLRPGAVPREAIERVLGAPLAAATANHRGASPGQLESHYAPVTPLRLNVMQPETGKRYSRLDLTLPNSRVEASISAQAAISKRRPPDCSLRSGSSIRPGVSAIAVMPIPGHGLGEAINDRLQRAANRR